MPATWYLVQYTADLRRHEPRNIGLALTDGAHWYLHFRGVDDLGRVDARQIRGWGISRETYQSWVDYFHRKALQGAWEEALTLQQRKPSNFSVVSGGMLLAEESDWELEAKQLFSELVTTRPHRVTAPSPLESARELFRRAEIHPEEDVFLPGRWREGGEQVGIPFKFQLTAAKTSTLEALPPKEKDIVSLKARLDAVGRVQGAPYFIALLPLSKISEKNWDQLLMPIEQTAHVVDMDAAEAPMQLRELVGV